MSKLDCATKATHILDMDTQTIRIESYDYLVVGSGLRRVFPTVPQSLRRVEFLQEAKQHTQNVRNAHEGVVIVGGGMSGYHSSMSRLVSDTSSYIQVLLAWKWPPN